MPAKEIQDEQEVIRWFEEGWSYQEMTEEYQRKYNIEMKPSAWGNFRYRKGLDRRIARDDELIPWAVERKHRSLYPLMMLRLEGRRRAGLPNDEEKTKRLESWKQMLEEENAVVHYDPDTVDGFFYVPREPKDDDIIRKPEKVTTLRRNADKRA
ncbi:putative repressor [Streptomyces phage phiHau3]|uniref:Putative repressor n=1 Tax=Streptomyces phage phiHau3 TaxID=1204524 RepID=K4HYL2_9CAUD|nr:transcriptional repressor [Streptomyces phage phiHau3]AFU62008.1 putative repressor [Streptomyces phage phiHau3]